MTDEVRQVLHDGFTRLLRAAIAGDVDGVTEELDRIGEHLDYSGIYAICCGLADLVMNLSFPGFTRGDGSLTGVVVGTTKVEGRAGNDPTLWANRFIVTHMNGDAETKSALFFGPLNDESETAEEDLLAGVLALVALTAEVVRREDAGQP